MTTDQLIRRIDDVELPTPGWWHIAGAQRVDLRTAGLRRRAIAATVTGGLTIAEDPGDSTLDLLIDAGRAGDSEHDLAIHATLASANAGGRWRFDGVVEGTVTTPIVVDVTYHGVYRRSGRALAWLTVAASLPRVNGRPRLVLAANINADHPGWAA